ncbi:MAG: sigma-70 family RNA polymerase sigma factor [Bacteroidia bacterium]|nr:sigma-70 family RNA polymerase sigma factor [Bacteroidia bacterium]MCF8427848.1 sigma-70 family RNA polymerase sigma factor [Bacteroidia bacterium]MCF8447739.1 sigma-70 family RNA polymerase sigma factor [Bacteroidia bacterium]
MKHKKSGITDQELVQRCMKNDVGAQKILFEHYSPMLLGVSYRYANSEDDAHEIVQLGFVKIFNNLSKFRFQSSLSTWLIRVVINTALNYLKANEKVKWESDIETLTENHNFVVEQLHQIDLKLLMNCIQELPTGYRIVLNMFAIEGYSHKEIAAELNITESTSRSQFVRAKALLEKKLISLGFDTNKYAGK